MIASRPTIVHNVHLGVSPIMARPAAVRYAPLDARTGQRGSVTRAVQLGGGILRQFHGASPRVLSNAFRRRAATSRDRR
jgi:hypothetical protein